MKDLISNLLLTTWLAELGYGGTAKWVRHSSTYASFDQLTAELSKVFGFKSCDAEAASGLIGLRRTEYEEYVRWRIIPWTFVPEPARAVEIALLFVMLSNTV